MLRATFDMLRALKQASGMKVNRNFEGFFADRLVTAFNEPTLIDAAERLAKGMDAGVEFVGGKKTAAFLSAASSTEAPHVLAWMRKHPRIVAMICMLRDDADYGSAIASIVIEQTASDESVVQHSALYDIPIVAECLSPLAHGSDLKAGNATLFRRRQVMTATGRVLELPFYAGNAIRGQLRDLLADDLVSALGLTVSRVEPALSLWFFHALYAGGVLEEGGKVTDKIEAQLGKNGSLRTEGLRQLRAMLPSISLLGTAVGNRVLPGRINVGDLRPRCKEWGTGDVAAHQLMEHVFLTRREDYEGRSEDDKHSGMIATTETLKHGTVLDGGIDVDTHTSDLERAALGRALQLLRDKGKLGAENRRGFGAVKLTIDNAPPAQTYTDYLAGSKAEILKYLTDIGALHAPRQSDLAA